MEYTTIRKKGIFDVESDGRPGGCTVRKMTKVDYEKFDELWQKGTKKDKPFIPNQPKGRVIF